MRRQNAHITIVINIIPRGFTPGEACSGLRFPPFTSIIVLTVVLLYERWKACVQITIQYLLRIFCCRSSVFSVVVLSCGASSLQQNSSRQQNFGEIVSLQPPPPPVAWFSFRAQRKEGRGCCWGLRRVGARRRMNVKRVLAKSCTAVLVKRQACAVPQYALWSPTAKVIYLANQRRRVRRLRAPFRLSCRIRTDHGRKRVQTREQDSNKHGYIESTKTPWIPQEACFWISIQGVFWVLLRFLDFHTRRVLRSKVLSLYIGFGWRVSRPTIDSKYIVDRKFFVELNSVIVVFG